MSFVAFQAGRSTLLCCVAALSMMSAATAVAADTPKPLYLQTIEAYPVPRLQSVSGREYKFLIDPAKTQTPVDKTFEDLWGQVKAAAHRRGFEMTQRKGNPLKIETSTKEYFDTGDQLLWAKGYIVRVTDRNQQGAPSSAASITIKRIGEDVVQTLATPLAVAGIRKVKTQAEENVGFGPGGTLRGYVEKGSSFNAVLDARDNLTLGDFGRYVPELLNLGLPADTVLVASKAFSYRIRPGKLELPGTGSSTISIEAWSAEAALLPYLYEVSFGYGDVDFYNAADTHTTGERFMTEVMREELGKLGGSETWKWGGSKVRRLMNRPLSKN